MIVTNIRKKKFMKKILQLMYYLRYLIFIFIISIIVLFITPKLFKHVNKIDKLNYILKNQHGLNLKNFNDIQYKVFPQPNLEIKDTNIFIGNEEFNLKIKKLKIYTNIIGLYFSDKILLKKIKFTANFLGNDIIGFYLPEKNNNYLYFEVKNIGVVSKFFLDNEKIPPKFSGKIKFKVLENNLLINFDFDHKLLFKNSVYKNKNIHASFDGEINFNPFFQFIIFTDIKKLNLEKFKFNKIYHLISEELSNRKLNGEIKINNLTNKIKGKNNQIDITFENGNISSKIFNLSLANLDIKMNFYLKRYPTYNNLDYKLLIKSDNINKFYKIINLKKNHKYAKVDLIIEGNINLSAQKYYFNKIEINKKKLNKEELITLKNYFDKNSLNHLNKEINKKNIYLILKELLETI